MTTRYIVTCAQNATPVHEPFWRALRRYADHLQAELIVLPIRYHNPTSTWSERDKADDWWDSAVVPYLLPRRKRLSRNLVLLGDISTQPTAQRPLSGFETLTGGRSAILGHTKIELATVPTPQSKLPKLLTTTGACTVANYTRSKAGKKGEFHHTYAAVIVEVDPPLFHLRHLVALQDGSFIDLDKEITSKSIRPAPRPEALITGDTHAVQADEGVIAATYEDPNSICAVLHPKRIVFHDLLDMRNRNHHERDNPFSRFRAWKKGLEHDSVESELRATFGLVDRVLPADALGIIVRSNHDEALEKWLRDASVEFDFVNARFYHESMAALYTVLEEDPGASINMLDHWAQQWLKAYTRVRFLDRGESCIVKDVELGYHGDLGPNGMRGTSGQFTRIGIKSVIGHSHSPGVKDGVYQVGTSSKLQLGYNKGEPSSWLHTHCLLYANGKRTLVHVIRGKWKGDS